MVRKAFLSMAAEGLLPKDLTDWEIVAYLTPFMSCIMALRSCKALAEPSPLGSATAQTWAGWRPCLSMAEITALVA